MVGGSDREEKESVDQVGHFVHCCPVHLSYGGPKTNTKTEKTGLASDQPNRRAEKW